MFTFFSAPNAPLNFTTIQEYSMVLETTLTFHWDQPRGINTERVIDSYLITVTPAPMMGFSRITRYHPSPFNITFAHNVQYNVSIFAVNCAGESVPTSLPAMEFSE